MWSGEREEGGLGGQEPPGQGMRSCCIGGQDRNEESKSQPAEPESFGRTSGMLWEQEHPPSLQAHQALSRCQCSQSPGKLQALPGFSSKVST